MTKDSSHTQGRAPGIVQCLSWWLIPLAQLACQGPLGPSATNEVEFELRRQAIAAEVVFELHIDRTECDFEPRQVVLQPSRERAYAFELDTDGKASGTIQGLSAGTYSVDAFALTADAQRICSTSQSLKVTPGAAVQTITVRCNDNCEPQHNDETEIVRCPSPSISGSSYGFRNVPTVLNSSVSPEQPVGYRWSSRTMTVDSSTEATAVVQCPNERGTHTLQLDITSKHCGGSATADLKCIDADASIVLEENLIGASPSAQLPITGAVFQSAEECPRRLKGEGGTWGCRELSSRLPSERRRARCACEWHGESPRSVVDRTAIDRFAGQKNWHADGPAVGASYAGISADALYDDSKQLSDRGRAYLGSNAKLEAALATVRVAVIDTTGRSLFDAGPVTDNVLHGRAVAAIVADTACSGLRSACPVTVLNYLALRTLGATTEEGSLLALDDKDGGNAGSLVDLSEAIDQAVDDWSRSADRESHLILNLSVGWDPAWGGTPADELGIADPLANSELLEPSQLVLESLIRASCEGALIFAAAGNRPPADGGGAGPAPPIYPAAWTALPAPTSKVCPPDSRVGAGKVDNGGPLLHAVGALDYGDQPLLVSRKKPSLASIGFAAIRQDPAKELGHTMLMTGTSASTAAVSGIAARLWAGSVSGTTEAYELPAHKLAQLLYSDLASRATSASADFCAVGAPCTEVRAVTLCSTDDCRKEALSVPLLTELANTSNPAGAIFKNDGNTAPSVPKPWVVPQPDGEPNCKVCNFLDQSNILDVEMREQFNPASVKDMRVYLSNKSGLYWPIPAAGRSFRFQLLSAGGVTGHGTVKYSYDIGVVDLMIEETLVITQ